MEEFRRAEAQVAAILRQAYRMGYDDFAIDGVANCQFQSPVLIQEYNRGYNEAIAEYRNN